VIIVGTDGSERAAVAVREALALAKMTGAKLHAVQVLSHNVAQGFSNVGAMQLEVNRLLDDAKAVETQLLAEAERQGVSLEVHNPGAGDPAEALISTAEALNADLVVVGNRGMSGVTRFVLGSVPNKVAHHCPCSVLIVNTATT
jgi:nucleotide-binding universal stress UspA family protein